MLFSSALIAAIEADHQHSYSSHEKNHRDRASEAYIDGLNCIIHTPIIHPLARLTDMQPRQEPHHEPERRRENDAEVTAFLRERYGNSEKKSRVAGWVLPAALFAIIGGAWLIWSGTHAAIPEIRSTLISFSSQSPSSIQIRYNVEIKSPMSGHQCTLVARDQDKNVVGEVIDRFPLGQAKLTREVTIPTRLQAVNAAITSCASL